ncbi:MAG: MFS transporter [Gammaproteobacteria bacterium]|nr:MFS transporter [Gammaproteobacteria bacterium]
MNAPLEQEASWQALLSREYLPKLATMALALWLHASNSMLTATTMPSAVDEIGGLNLISWTFALYLAGSIMAAASISLLVAKMGLKKTMIRAGLVFSAGCVMVAVAPNMPLLLLGRVFQGFGGGGLIALVYVSQDRFFPNHLVPKTVAFLSSVWMMASFSGPIIGGAFATVGEWRLAYWAFAAQGLLLIPAVNYLLKASEPELSLAAEPVPIIRLLLLGASILLVSLSGAYFHPLGSPILILLGCLCLVSFVLRDRFASNARMLPVDATNFSHAIGSGILGTLLLCISIMSFLVYGPLILIDLYGLTPLEAGFIVLLESLAWGSAAIIFSGTSAAAEPRLIKSGGAIVLLGLFVMAFIFPRGWLWAVVLAVIMLNGGFGMMWGFIIKRIIAAAAAEDKDRTASLLPITQQTGFALGAALSGLIANGFGIDQGLGPVVIREIAFWLFAGFVPIALIGNIMVWRFVSFETG